jgi:predicted GNAT superfamily acetyltransferase
VGFVHTLVALQEKDEIIGYSHMMAVARDFQNKGLGARLKWAQREKALSEGRRFIKWTWDPMQARNAHFNLNRLGVTVQTYADNFYGLDYFSDPSQKADKRPGLQSDRLFASWELTSARVENLAAGRSPSLPATPAETIAIPADWGILIKSDVAQARAAQERVRTSFKQAFAAGLVCAGFERSEDGPRYLLYERREIV